MTPTNPLPTFQALRQQHGLSLEALYEHGERAISMEEIRLFDETGRANPYIVDDLLFLLSECSGQHYDRTNVGGIVFVLACPPASPTHPQPRSGCLPAQPTPLDLYHAYHLHLDWVGEALERNNRDIWDMLNETTEGSNRPLLEQFLHLLSHYTGVDYTLENVRIGKRPNAFPSLLMETQMEE